MLFSFRYAALIKSGFERLSCGPWQRGDTATLSQTLEVIILCGLCPEALTLNIVEDYFREVLGLSMLVVSALNNKSNPGCPAPPIYGHFHCKIRFCRVSFLYLWIGSFITYGKNWVKTVFGLRLAAWSATKTTGVTWGWCSKRASKGKLSHYLPAIAL